MQFDERNHSERFKIEIYQSVQLGHYKKKVLDSIMRYSILVKAHFNIKCMHNQLFIGALSVPVRSPNSLAVKIINDVVMVLLLVCTEIICMQMKYLSAYL